MPFVRCVHSRSSLSLMSVRRLEVSFGRLSLSVSEVVAEEDEVAAEASAAVEGAPISRPAAAPSGRDERAARRSREGGGSGSRRHEQGEAAAPEAERRVHHRPPRREPSAEPAPEGERRVHRRPPRPAASNFYVIWAVPAGGEPLLGVHQCTWSELSAKLPGGGIIGSPYRDAKKFADLESALDYFWRRNSTAAECRVHGA